MPVSSKPATTSSPEFEGMQVSSRRRLGEANMIDGEKSIRWEELSEEEARRHNLCKALLKGRR